MNGYDTFRNTSIMSSRRETESAADPFSNTMPSSFMQTTHVNDDCRDKIFQKKIKKEGFDLPGVSQILPCSIEAVDHLHEIFIEGKSKLDQEVRHAQSIPANQRKIIDKNYLAQVEMASREGDRPEPQSLEQHGYNSPCPGIGDTYGLYDEELIA